MLIHEIHCFGADRKTGNRALVVQEAALTAEQRLRFAAMARRPACVFMSADGELDYIYPHGRSPLCLHATLAAARVLFLRHTQETSITVRTAMHQQPLVLTQDEARYFVGLSVQEAPAPDIDAATVASLLRCAPQWLGGSAAVRSVGSPKLLVPMRDQQYLRALAPDLPEILAWGRQHGVNGIYAYAPTAGGDIEGRNFNHLDPLLEDSATGVAAGALAVLLGRNAVVHQGGPGGNPCVIHARIEGNQVQVGGLAVPGAGGAILHDLESFDAQLRERATGRVNQLDAVLAVPALLRRLDDEDPHVRNAARMMFQRLQVPENAAAFELFLPAIEALRRAGREDHGATVDVTLAYLKPDAKRPAGRTGP